MTSTEDFYYKRYRSKWELLGFGRSWGAIMSKSVLIEGSINVQLTGLGENTDWRYIFMRETMAWEVYNMNNMTNPHTQN
jgi:hypothetical protein